MSRRLNIASDNNNNIVFYDNRLGSTTRRLQSDVDPINNIHTGDNSQNLFQPTYEQQAPPAAAFTLAGQPRQRRKWTNEINEALLRTYYVVTQQEQNLTGYRTQLRTIFVAQHPEFDVSEQRLSDQIRTIHRNNLIPEIRRNAIKESTLITTSNTNSNDTDMEENNIILNEIQRDVDSQINVQGQEEDQTRENTDTINNPYSDVSDIFEEQYDIFKQIDPLMRPSIPKINTCLKLSKVTQYVNDEIIAKRISRINTLGELHTLIYASAVTISMKMGFKIRYINSRTNKPIENATLKRIEIKINELRSELERVKRYMSGNNSRRLRNKIRRIFKKHNKHSRYELNNSNAILISDTIKQKLSVQVTKQRKYKLSTQRRKNNKIFKASEKNFYRTLRAKQDSSEEDTLPSKEDVERYWSSIWSKEDKHNSNAEWIKDEKQRHHLLEEMVVDYVTTEQVKHIISKTHNWKSPGPDKIQNFWLKRLPAVHEKLALLINECIQDPTQFPCYLANGITYLLPKGTGFRTNPANGRPITCLPTMYKIMTACINLLIYNHVTQNHIICEEQKGCCKNAKGCKEQLTIDQIILEQTTKRAKNLHCCYIDYQKAFDSVPHSWLIEVMEIYKIHPNIVNFLKNNMAHWRTNIEIFAKTKPIRTSGINIKCGIFQGDCLSALWFCIALNPLSNLLKNSKYGYKIKGNTNREVLSHLLYMDDLKIFASTKQHLDQQIKIVSMFSDDINMKFGLEKCKTISINRGKMTKTQDPQIRNIKEMEEEDVYKYLGMVQNNRINKTIVKNTLTSEFKSRIHKIAKANLSGKFAIKALNTFAIPILTYSFGIIKWSTTELQALQRKIRTMLTSYKLHHPKSCLERMITSRREGGRGLLDLQTLHDNQIQSLREYFHQKSQRSNLIKSIAEADENLTPLNLNGDFERKAADKNTRERNWAIKPIHGQYYRAINDDNVDKQMSHRWLLNCELYAETEAFMIAIQDRVIPTKNYKKHVMKDPTVGEDNCRRCGNQPETIDHIISSCTSLAQTEYTRRHNNVAKILHKKLLEKYLLQHDNVPYYAYKPAPVVENENIKIYYDRTIHSEHTRLHNRPDITIIDKKEREGIFIDVAIPANRNIRRTYTEKRNRYSELAVEIKRSWNLKKVKIIPIVISAEGIIHKELREDIRKLGLRQNTIDAMQKAVIIDTCHTTRNFMNIN